MLPHPWSLRRVACAAALALLTIAIGAPRAVAAADAAAAPADTTPAPAAESANPPAAGGLVGRNVPTPDTPPARIAAALRKGDRAGALKIADDFLVEHPRDAQVRFLRAVVLGDLGRTREATSVLESLTEDFPELAEPYNNLAVIHANEGKLETAEHDLQLAIAAQPNYVTARENLGDLYVSMAAAAYEQALVRDPSSQALKKKLALARELGSKLRSTR